MRIKKEHYFHGAVLIQIAEHEQFTAINALRVGGIKSRSAFKVNNDIVVYLKYASEPVEPYDEYLFTFNRNQMLELNTIAEGENDLHIALVCVKDNEVCCFSYDEFMQLISRRKERMGKAEDQYSLLVTLKKGKSFRVNVNSPGKKGQYLGEPLIVHRNACPNVLFR